jgi:hypothetical protein
MNNFGASGRIIQNVSVCHLKTPTCFGDNEEKKNPLVFPSRCEKLLPAFSYRWKIKLLLRRRRISTAANNYFPQ